MASTRTDLGRKSAPLLTERYEVMFPTVLPRAIQIAAERALMTPAEYVPRKSLDACKEMPSDRQAAEVRGSRTFCVSGVNEIASSNP